MSLKEKISCFSVWVLAIIFFSHPRLSHCSIEPNQTLLTLSDNLNTSCCLAGLNGTNDLSYSYNWYTLSLSSFSLFGIFGNILVCLTIKRDQSLQTKTNYYLFSLALADLAVCLIVIPLSIVQDFYSE